MHIIFDDKICVCMRVVSLFPSDALVVHTVLVFMMNYNVCQCSHNTPLLLQFMKIAAVQPYLYGATICLYILLCGHADTHLSTNYPQRIKTHNTSESTT